MRNDFRWKGITIFALAFIFSMLISPVGQKFFKGDPIRTGLDLKGGIELLLAPDYRVGGNALAKFGAELIAKVKQANIAEPKLEPLGVSDNGRFDGVLLTFNSAAEAQRAQNIGAFASNYTLDFFGETKHLHNKAVVKGNRVEIEVLQDAKDFPGDALDRTKAIIDNRISETSGGMAEADVRLDGKGRLNVQLPGIQTLQEAQDLITATGRLTFRINSKIVLDGTDLNDIGVNFQAGKGYVISFAFKGNGAKTLAQITADNVGKNMGVYLDEKELMNPVIQYALPDGSGIIELGNTPKEEVERDALLMKSGALPISLRVMQSTQVAPTLGKEIIKQSLISGAIGIILVMAFMLFFYGVPGLMTNLALALYAVFVLGVMALFRGVLTLPGVAGFILSLGMAVDANIIIFERIKDEIRNGKRVRPAVVAGFDRAYITILDSNITTLIAAGVLFFMGSGSIQGFAVTLSIGILVSMFTALFVTRFFLDWRIDHDPDRYAKYFGVKEVISE